MRQYWWISGQKYTLAESLMVAADTGAMVEGMSWDSDGMEEFSSQNMMIKPGLDRMRCDWFRAFERYEAQSAGAQEWPEYLAKATQAGLVRERTGYVTVDLGSAWLTVRDDGRSVSLEDEDTEKAIPWAQARELITAEIARREGVAAEKAAKKAVIDSMFGGNVEHYICARSEGSPEEVAKIEAALKEARKLLRGAAPLLEVVNLTPHPISIADDAGEVVATFAPSGTVARRSTVLEDCEPLRLAPGGRSIPVARSEYGPVTGLPSPTPNTVYIVSMLVLDAPECQSRNDVFCPDTGPGSVVRDKDGHIVAVKRLRRA